MIPDDISTMTVEQIKVELFDLQSHNCNGRLTLNPDGSRDPGDRLCSGCSRAIALTNALHTRLKQGIEAT